MLSNLCEKISKTTVKKQNKVEFKGFNPVAAKDEISRPEDLTCVYMIPDPEKGTNDPLCNTFL